MNPPTSSVNGRGPALEPEAGATPPSTTVDGGSASAKPSPEHIARLVIPPEVLRTLPAEFVKQHRVLPFAISRNTLRIAVTEEVSERVIEDIRLLSGLEVEQSLAPSGDLLEKLAECYQITVEQMIENLNPESSSSVEIKNLHDIEVMANEPTVINLVNLIISTALRERASDIHIVPFDDSVQLRYRIDGLLQEKPPPPKQLQNGVEEWNSKRRVEGTQAGQGGGPGKPGKDGGA